MGVNAALATIDRAVIPVAPIALLLMSKIPCLAVCGLACCVTGPMVCTTAEVPPLGVHVTVIVFVGCRFPIYTTCVGVMGSVIVTGVVPMTSPCVSSNAVPSIVRLICLRNGT